MEKECIYYVSAISLNKNTEEDVKRMYEIHKIKYNKPNLSFEDFVKFMSNWEKTDYSIDSFISSYHTSLGEALFYAINNAGDINEAGCYNYVGVVRAKVGYTYYDSNINSTEDIFVGRYNRESDEYELIGVEDELYEVLIQHLYGYFPFKIREDRKELITKNIKKAKEEYNSYKENWLKEKTKLENLKETTKLKE